MLGDGCTACEGRGDAHTYDIYCLLPKEGSGCVPCGVCGGSQDRGWHKHPTPQDRAAEVLAAHGWRHTATTHCMCGWRSPLAQLAVDGYYAHVAAALAEEGLLADKEALMRARGMGWQRAHTTMCSDIYPICKHRNPWVKARAGDALDAARDEVAEWQEESGRIAFERDLLRTKLNESREASESGWIEGWRAAMDWLAEYKGEDGIAIAKEMATRLPESSE